MLFHCPLNPDFDRFYSEPAELLSPSPILGDFPYYFPQSWGARGAENHHKSKIT